MKAKWGKLDATRNKPEIYESYIVVIDNKYYDKTKTNNVCVHVCVVRLPKGLW